MMISSWRARLNRILVVSVAIASLAASRWTLPTAQAEDGNPVSRAAAATANISRWISQLDSDSFADREDSAQRLYDTGSDAIKPLAEAARGHSYEQTAAAIGVLRRMLKSDDSEAGKAAQTALEQIAQGHCDAAATLAADALQPLVELPEVVYLQQTPGMRRMNAMRLRAVQLQVAVAAVPVVVVESTVAHDNGKKIQIDEDPQNGLRMRVSEKVNGVLTEKSYQAKDADELKQKSPDAHKMYETAKKSKEAMHFQSTETALR
jgi:hypothetical protein